MPNFACLLKLLGVLAAVFVLAACQSDRATTTATTATDSDRNRAVVTDRVQERDAPAEELSDRVFFDYDRSDLRPQARATIEGWAEWLARNPQYRVTIEGHADERGTREYNLALGNRRANVVMDYLIAHGVEPDRISTVSYGKERPEVLGSNEAAWAQNRRGVLVVN